MIVVYVLVGGVYYAQLIIACFLEGSACLIELTVTYILMCGVYYAEMIITYVLEGGVY